MFLARFGEHALGNDNFSYWKLLKLSTSKSEIEAKASAKQAFRGVKNFTCENLFTSHF